MAEAITRLGDMCTGHGAWPPRPSTSASDTVFVDGLGVHCVGDTWAVHCDPNPSCHGGVLAAGSSTVFIAGKAVGRVGDPVDCGSLVAEGSSTVFCG